MLFYSSDWTFELDLRAAWDDSLNAFLCKCGVLHQGRATFLYLYSFITSSIGNTELLNTYIFYLVLVFLEFVYCWDFNHCYLSVLCFNWANCDFVSAVQINSTYFISHEPLQCEGWNCFSPVRCLMADGSDCTCSFRERRPGARRDPPEGLLRVYVFLNLWHKKRITLVKSFLQIWDLYVFMDFIIGQIKLSVPPPISFHTLDLCVRTITKFSRTLGPHCTRLCGSQIKRVYKNKLLFCVTERDSDCEDHHRQYFIMYEAITWEPVNSTPGVTGYIIIRMFSHCDPCWDGMLD